MTKSNYPYSLVIKYRESAERLKWMEKTLPGEGIDRVFVATNSDEDAIMITLKWV